MMIYKTAVLQAKAGNFPAGHCKTSAVVRAIPLLTVMLIACYLPLNAGPDRTAGPPGHGTHGWNLSGPMLPESGAPVIYSASLQQPEGRRSLFRRRGTMVLEQEMGLGGNILGPTLGYVSAYLQYSFGRVVQIEAGLDLSGVYAGLNFYPRLFDRFEDISPYMGLMIGRSDPEKLNLNKGTYAYMPIGIRYVTGNDWFICIELAATTANNVSSAPMFMGIKLGYLIMRK